MFFLHGILFTNFAQAEITIKTTDHNKDGNIDTWEYFENGEMIKKEIDMNFDGKPDFWIYFKGGEKIRIEADYNADGLLDMWNYIENEVYISKSDRNYDGKIDMIFSGDDPNWIDLRVKKIDLNFDGKFDCYSVNNSDNEIVYEYDINNNNVMEKKIVFNNDDALLNFNPHTILFDNNEDKIFDTFIYYKKGEAVKVEKDTNNDGIIDSTIDSKALLALPNLLEKIKLSNIKKELGLN